MKIFNLFLFIVITLFFACDKPPKVPVESVSSHSIDLINGTPTYDSLLAQKVGADDYGMKLYVMAFLKRGPNRDRDSTEAAELQKAHMANINRLAEEGKLVLAGPFGGNGDLRGIYVFDVPTVEEAQKLTETDPAIQAGSLEMELIQWYGSASLGFINDLHTRVAKIEM